MHGTVGDAVLSVPSKMVNHMLHIKEVIIVEGKYDKQHLRRITDAVILETNGFALYRDKSLIETIRNFAKTRGVIVLTDSDGAGFRIRNYIKQCVGQNGTVKQAYIPTVAGKERRKEKGGKEGIMGVEGIDEATLAGILLSVSEIDDMPIVGAAVPGRPSLFPHDSRLVTKQTFFEDGLTGKYDSKSKRERLCEALGLPKRLSANGMIDVINKVYGYEAYREAIKKSRKQ